LLIEADQQPWCPEFDGETRTSSLQTGVHAGALGSVVGQHHFRDGLVVRETQRSVALYTPRYGLFECRASAIDDPATMVALWMIGFEDRPERSAEICVFEVFGRDVGPGSAAIGMGLHPFRDPLISDDFSRTLVGIDARAPHDYAVEWTPEHVAFFVDERLVRVSGQSPSYPMQFMLDVFEFVEDGPQASSAHRYPKVFRVEWFRGYRPVHGPGARRRAFPGGEAGAPGGSDARG
jgi:hypothetical protein